MSPMVTKKSLLNFEEIGTETNEEKSFENGNVKIVA